MFYIEPEKIYRKSKIRKVICLMIVKSLLISTLVFSYLTENKLPYKNCLKPQEIFKIFENRVFKLYSLNKNTLEINGTGTALMTDNGSLITSTHVVEGENIFFISLNNKQIEYKIQKPIGNAESITRLTPVVKVLPMDNHKLTFSTALNGEEIYSMGFPYGDIMRFTHGFVSNVHDKYINVDMLMHPGMSGSPVLDCSGNVIGYILGYHSVSQSFGIVNFYND